MSRISSDEQLNFLLNCVKFSNNGKVDFEAVAKECNIVSKGAAAKRYERMMKANGINPNGGPAIPDEDGAGTGDGNTPAQTPKKAKTPRKPKGGAAGTPKTPASGKKRKAAETPRPTPGKKIKTEDAGFAVKTEDYDEGAAAENDQFMLQTDGAQDDDALFNQFCNTGADEEAEQVVNGAVKMEDEA